MKATLSEYDGYFSIFMDPESAEEVVQLARMAMNTTTKLQGVHTFLYLDGTARGMVFIGKRKDASSSVRKTRG